MFKNSGELHAEDSFISDLYFGGFFSLRALNFEKGRCGLHSARVQGRLLLNYFTFAELSFCWAISQIGPYFVCLCVGLCQDHRIHGTEHACNGLLTLGGFK